MANAGTNHLLYQQGFQATDNLYFRLQEGLQRARYGDFMASLVLHTTVILEQANLLRELLQDSRTMFNKVMENTQAIKSLENKTTALERQFLEQNLVPPSPHQQQATCTVYPQVGEPPVHIMCGPARNDQPPLLSLARMAQTQHVETIYPYQRPAICQPPPPPPDYPNVRHPILPHQQYAFSGNPVFPVQRSYGLVQHPPRMYPPQQISVPHHRLTIAESSPPVGISTPAVTQSTNVTTTITTTTATTVTNSTAALSSNRTSIFPHLILPEGISIIPLSPSKGKKTKESSKNEQPSVVIQPVNNHVGRDGRLCTKKRITSPTVANQPPVMPSISINELQVDAVDDRSPALKRSTEKGMNLDRLLQKITVLSQNRPAVDRILPSNERINSGLPVGSRRRKSNSKQRPQYVSPVYEEEEEEEEEIEEYPEIAELGYRNVDMGESFQSQSDKVDDMLPIIVSVEGSVNLNNVQLIEDEEKDDAEIDQSDAIDMNLHDELCNGNSPNIEDELFSTQEFDSIEQPDENLFPCDVSDYELMPVVDNFDDKVIEHVVDNLISNAEMQNVVYDDENNEQDDNQETEVIKDNDVDELVQNNIFEELDEVVDRTIVNNDNSQVLSNDSGASNSCRDQEMDESSINETNDGTDLCDNEALVDDAAFSDIDGEEISCKNLVSVENENDSIEKDNLTDRRRIPAKKSKFSIWSAMAYRSRKKKRKPRIKIENSTPTGNVRQSKKTKATITNSPVWPSQDITVRRSKRKALSHEFLSTEKTTKIVSPVIIVGKLNKTDKRRRQGLPTLAAMQSRLDTLQLNQPEISDVNKPVKTKARIKRKHAQKKDKNIKKLVTEMQVGDEISLTQTILTHSDALTAVSALEQVECPIAVRDVVEDLVEITHLREQAESEECGMISPNGGSLEMATLTRAIRIWQEHDYSRFPIELLKSTDIPEFNDDEQSGDVPVQQTDLSINDQSCSSQQRSSEVDTQSRISSPLENIPNVSDPNDVTKTKDKSSTKGKLKSCRRITKRKCLTCTDCQGNGNQKECIDILESQTPVALETTESDEGNVASSGSSSSSTSSRSTFNISGENVDNKDNLKDVIRTKLQRLRADSSSPSVDREDDYACLFKAIVHKRSVLSENNTLVPPTEQNVNIKSIKHRLSFAIAGGFVTNFPEDDETSSLQPQVQCVNIFSIHEIWKYLKSFINDATRTVLALHQLGNKEIQQFLVLARLCLLDAHKDENDLYFKKTDQTQDLSVEMLEKAIKVLESNNALVD